MIIIAGTIDLADPSMRDEVIEKAKPLQQATRDDEPGCLAYVFSADPCVDGRIVVYELWEDEATLAAHFKHENYFNMGGMLRESGMAGADNNKYRVDLSEPVYDETHTPRADFFSA
jgi:quinol monooxygenase YgiN